MLNGIFPSLLCAKLRKSQGNVFPFHRNQTDQSNEFIRHEGIVLARDPPTRLFGRVYGHLDGFGWGGQLSKTLKISQNGRAVSQNPSIWT